MSHVPQERAGFSTLGWHPKALHENHWARLASQLAVPHVAATRLRA